MRVVVKPTLDAVVVEDGRHYSHLANPLHRREQLKGVYSTGQTIFSIDPSCHKQALGGGGGIKYADLVRANSITDLSDTRRIATDAGNDYAGGQNVYGWLGLKGNG